MNKPLLRFKTEAELLNTKYVSYRPKSHFYEFAGSKSLATSLFPFHLGKPVARYPAKRVALWMLALEYKKLTYTAETDLVCRTEPDVQVQIISMAEDTVTLKDQNSGDLYEMDPLQLFEDFQEAYDYLTEREPETEPEQHSVWETPRVQAPAKYPPHPLYPELEEVKKQASPKSNYHPLYPETNPPKPQQTPNAEQLLAYLNSLDP